MALIKGKQIAGSSIELSKLQQQSSGEILVADNNGDLQAVALSGHATIASTGALTVADNAISSARIADSAVTFAKLSDDAVCDDLSLSASDVKLARSDAAKSYADARYADATQYADSVAQGLDVKSSVRVATTAAITLASELENGDTIDGIVLATGDRVLLKDQADASENGIYVVAESGAPSRATDADQDNLTGGAFVFVEEGTANADNGFACTNNGTPTLDTDDVVFAQFSGAGSVVAGAGLSKTGNQLDIQVDDAGIELIADTLQLKDLGVVEAKIQDAAVTESKLAASIAGDGLAGGAGSSLSVDLDQLTAEVIDVLSDSIAFIDADDNATRKESVVDFVSAMASTAISASSGQLSAAVLSTSNQFSTASATAADGDTTGVSLQDAPVGMVQVFVNGIMVHLSGDKLGDCYFSSDAGTTAKALGAAGSDTLYWNGSVASYQLEATDEITLVYQTLA